MPIARMLESEKYKGITIDFERTYDYTPNLSWFVEATWRYSTRGKQQRVEGKNKTDAFKKVKKEIDQYK